MYGLITSNKNHAESFPLGLGGKWITNANVCANGNRTSGKRIVKVSICVRKWSNLIISFSLHLCVCVCVFVHSMIDESRMNAAPSVGMPPPFYIRLGAQHFWGFHSVKLMGHQSLFAPENGPLLSASCSRQHCSNSHLRCFFRSQQSKVRLKFSPR